jgi:CDP-4-dehydro-6-deoxyglucose reductase
VEGPHGDFVLREDSPEPAVFVAIGDGIGPVKSLIEHAVSIDVIESFHLYWGTEYPEGHYQGKWGRALKESLDNFYFTPLMSSDPRDLLAVIRADLPELGSLRFYLAGPGPGIESMRTSLRDLGVPEDRIAIEATES